MAKVLDAYQSWLLSVRNAIDNDQPIPIPAYSPPMTASERDAWQTHVRQNIHHDAPMTPQQFLQSRAQVRSVDAIRQSWNDLAAHRIAQAQDTGGES